MIDRYDTFCSTNVGGAPLRALLAGVVIAVLAGVLAPPTLAQSAGAELAASDDAETANQTIDPSLYGDMEYRMIGPYRGGRVTAVAGIADQKDTFYMGATGGGVWKTTNAGQDWTNISDGEFAVSSIGAIDVADSDASVIYVGTGSACIRGNVQAGNGVYKSTDGGETWTHVGLKDAGQIGKLKVHPSNPDVAYVAALGHAWGENEMRGVFRTTDGGDSWEKVLYVSENTGAVDLALNPENPREIYAGLWPTERKPWTLVSGNEEGGIFKTTDGGDNWKRLKGGLPQGVVGKTAVTVSPAKPSRVWALVEAPEPKGGLYRSDDHGQTWTHVNDSRKHQQRAWYYTHLYAHPTDPHTVYSLNTRFYESVDGGKTFESFEVPHGDEHDLWINPQDPSTMVVGNDGGAQVTHDGAETWSTYFNQPTAEMYSVTVDEEFPYHVYGPQQDNSTIRVPSWTEGSIHPKSNWTSVGGCETGPIALHPDRPHLIYSGCYGGSLTRWNEQTEQARNVMVYPQLQLGQKPSELRERFQWNSPIVVNPHDGDVIYHASQHVWKSTDRGMSWARISDDLTTDTPEHQDYAGEPITKDNTGVEVFNTVFSLVVSPHAKETLWAGTDDGRIWITRNEGGSWTEITPEGLPEYGTVNRIDVSPHNPGTAYAAVHRYRLDDWSPYIYKTTDYGESWTQLATGDNGIPSDHPVHVVREDPDREGLLYAGTEFALYISFDDGENWQSLQKNLPVTRVSDLKVHQKDLVVATHGRSFWVLDDLSPLHEASDQIADRELHLFQPRTAHLANPSSGHDPSRLRHEERTPHGPDAPAFFNYYLSEAPDTTMTLEITDANGTVVRSFTSDSTAAEDDREQVLPATSGMHRFGWNLTGEKVETPDDAIVWGYTGGPRMAPGTYEATLRIAGGPSATRRIEVKMDPRLEDVTAADLQATHDFATTIRDTLTSVYDAVRMIRSVRDQVQSMATYAEEAGRGDDLVARADTVSKALSEIEQKLMQTKNESHQDPLNYPPMFDNQVAYLYGLVAPADGPPTDAARERFEDLNQQWADLRTELEEVMDTEVGAFTQRLRDLGQPIFVPTSSAR